MRSKLAALIFISILVVTFSLLIFSFTFAKAYPTPPNASALEKRAEIKDQLKIKTDQLREKKEGMKATIAARKLEIKEKVATRRAEIQQKVVANIKTVFGKILTRYEAALSRFDKIIARIDSRIAKLKDRGVDTSAAEAKLAEVKAQLTEAIEAVAKAKVEVEAIDPNASTRDAVHQAVAAVRNAKQEIIDVHQALAKTVRELKASINLRTATGSAQEGTESAETE